MAYINREQTEKAIRKYADQKHSNGEQIEYVNGILKSISVINEQPTADVVEVKHGYWKQNSYCNRIFYCSECGRHIEDATQKPNEFFPYCHCGAKMDGERK